MEEKKDVIQEGKVIPLREGFDLKDLPEDVTTEDIIEVEAVTVDGEAPPEPELDFSVLDISLRIPNDRPVNVPFDMKMSLDGNPIEGIGEVKFSMFPHSFSMIIVDGPAFQKSINKAGWFHDKQSFFISELRFGRGFPAPMCATCNKGHLLASMGGKCSNPECENASPEIKAAHLQQQFLEKRDAAETLTEAPSDESVTEEPSPE